jgi:hypothetical protein
MTNTQSHARADNTQDPLRLGYVPGVARRMSYTNLDDGQ